MKEVTPEKLHRLHRNPEEWNGNTIPEDMFQDIYEIAANDPESKNKKDMEAQKKLYIQLFECCKSYGLTKIVSSKFWKNHPSCKHPDEFHEMLEFPNQAVDPISHDVGCWTTWYDPDPLAVPAKVRKTNNMPKKEDRRTSEVKIEVNSVQFAKLLERSKVDYDESQIIRHEGFGYSSSDSSEDEGVKRRAIILKRAEQAERYVQRVEHREEREERLLEL